MTVQEGDYLRVGVETVPQLGEAVALVLVEQVLDRAAVSLHAVNDLLRLSDGHPRVVLTVHDHERSRDAPRLVNRADGLKELAIPLQGAVLGLAQRATVAASVFEEGDEVGNTYDIHPGSPEIGVLREGREHHEPAVGAAHDDDAFVPTLPEPVRRVREIPDGI